MANPKELSLINKSMQAKSSAKTKLYG